MKVELLHIDDCPNWQQTLADIITVLKEYDVGEEVEVIKVGTAKEAERLSFLGSPTVRIDDVDVELDIPESGYNLECRLYWVDETPLRAPPIVGIGAAVESALG